MKNRNLSLWYYDDNHTPEYKRTIFNYLSGKEKEFLELTQGKVLIDLYSFERSEESNFNGHVFLSELESGRFFDVVDYFFSKDRAYIPVCVSGQKKDYNLIENILKENYGKKGRLTNGFLGLGYLANFRFVKRK